MKKALHLFLIVSSLALQTSLFANTFIVKGYITDNNNRAVANKTVRIYTDSTNQSCIVSHTKITNANGYYIDTVSCNADIRKISIAVADCNGHYVINTPSLTASSNIIESNFAICVSSLTLSPNCYAVFSYTSATQPAHLFTGSAIHFSSAASQPPTGDSIVNRNWYFGDTSQTLTGNSINPSHVYTKAGTYNVCLSIKTRSGCESKYCTNIVVIDSVPPTPIPTACKAFFSFTLQGNTVTVNSLGSAPASNTDSIISRTWYFSDSTNAPITGNHIDVSHTFAKPGTYTIYLAINTKQGCVSKYSLTVVIPPSSTECHLQVQINNAKQSARVFRFYSSQSTAGQGDSIIQRNWTFGDGTTLAGNEISPLKEFKDTGSYTVCVTIKTKNGCEKQACTTVLVKDSVPVTTVPTNCKAVFSYTIQSNTVQLNSSASQATSSTDTIISRTWYFSDSTATSLNGNSVSPSHTFAKPGTYTVYLIIKTKKGCESRYSATVVIPQPSTECHLQVQIINAKQTARRFRFYSFQSTAGQGDSIIQRNWNFGDGTTLAGNEISPLKEFTDTGSYTVCVTIKTKNGCEKQACMNVQVKDTVPTPLPVPTNCKALFTYSVQSTTVAFNSSTSAGTSADDSIISRYWIFGDSSSTVAGSSVTGNLVTITHTYAKAGTYQVLFYIKTKKGCESKFAATVVIAPNTVFHCEAQAQFSTENLSLKNVQFNSSLSKAQAGDSIIQRSWHFGDSPVLGGDVISPVKEYTAIGYYNTCLQIVTERGCQAQVCKEIKILDSVTTPQSTIEYIKIISINPNPVSDRMMLTVWSRNSNAEAEIIIYDIYGTPKLTLKKILAQGNNTIEISVGNLFHGPYFLKVGTTNGKDSKQFYKL